MYRRYNKVLGCGAKKSSDDVNTAEAENRGWVGTTRQQVPQTMPKVPPLPPIATSTGGEETSRMHDPGQQPPL